MSLSDLFSNPPKSGVTKTPSASAIEDPALKMERPFEFALKVQVFSEGQKTYHPVTDVNLKPEGQ